jgi:cell division protein FtsB
MGWFRKRADREVSQRATPSASTPDASSRQKQDTSGQQEAAERRFKRGFRSYAFVLSCIFVVGSVSALFGEDGFLDKLRLRSEIRKLEGEVALQRQNVITLEREIQALETDPMARERIAREQLGLAFPDEYLFILPEEGTRSGQAAPGAEPSP